MSKARVSLVLALCAGLMASGAAAVAAEDAGKDDVSKKSFKHPEGDGPPAVGQAGYVRKSKVDLMSAATGGTTVATLEGGTKVMAAEDAGEWLKVSTDAGQSGYVMKADVRTKAPVEWHSNRNDIQYQECLGKKKECDDHKAKKVDKKDVLLEVDRGGPDNAFVYVKMPGDTWGWVPIAFMMEWKEKFK